MNCLTQIARGIILTIIVGLCLQFAYNTLEQIADYSNKMQEQMPKLELYK